jgi:hypothetical protein
MLDSVANLVCRSGNLYLEQSHPKFAKLLFSRYLLFRPALRHPSDFFTHCTQERDLTVIQCMILYINSSKYSPVLQRHSPSIGDISIRVHTTDDSCPTLKQRCTRQAHVVKLHVTHIVQSSSSCQGKTSASRMFLSSANLTGALICTVGV